MNASLNCLNRAGAWFTLPCTFAVSASIALFSGAIFLASNNGSLDGNFSSFSLESKVSFVTCATSIGVSALSLAILGLKKCARTDHVSYSAPSASAPSASASSGPHASSLVGSEAVSEAHGILVLPPSGQPLTGQPPVDDDDDGYVSDEEMARLEAELEQREKAGDALVISANTSSPLVGAKMASKGNGTSAPPRSAQPLAMDEGDVSDEEMAMLEAEMERREKAGAISVFNGVVIATEIKIK